VENIILFTSIETVAMVLTAGFNWNIGWLTPETRLAYLNRTEDATRVEVLSLWQKTSLKEKISDMYWQFGFSGYSYGRNHDDGFTIYLDE